MTSAASYRCEECDTLFDSQQDLIQHEIYARYRRPAEPLPITRTSQERLDCFFFVFFSHLSISDK